MRGKHLSEPGWSIQALDEGMGLNVTMHNLRRTFANETLSADNGARRVKVALNQPITGDVTWENYANNIKPKLGQLLPIMTEQEERIRLIVEGGSEAQGAPRTNNCRKPSRASLSLWRQRGPSCCGEVRLVSMGPSVVYFCLMRSSAPRSEHAP